MENTEKSAAPAATGAGGAKDKVEKQARQLAYDVRYKVRQSLKAQAGGKSDPAAVRKAYMGQLAKSPSNPAVKTRAKQMLMGEGYIDVDSLVAQGAASAMYKVFVEHHEKDADGNVIPHEEINEDEVKEKTYKVRVTDKETGNSYVRNATRAKIAELRNNPNISSVEMTEYGEVTKSEKHKGSQTASVKAGKGVDYDGDGKKESSSKEHAGVVHNAIQRKKGGTPDGKDTRKEDYTWKDAFGELIEKTKVKKEETEDKKITGEGVNNAKLIKVFPDDIKEDAKYGYDKDGKSLNPADQEEEEREDDELFGSPKSKKKKKSKDVKEGAVKKEVEDLQTAAETGKGKYVAKADAQSDVGGTPASKQDEVEDPRSMYTKWNLVKNRLRAMGLKMSQELEGETIEESEKLAQKAYDRAQKLGAKRRAKQGVNRGVGKSERAGYNLAQSQRSRNASAETQGGNQTGGGSKSFGYAKNKSNPVKSKRTGDTGALGHYKKRDEKTSVGKKGGKLKTPKYKLSSGERLDHHSTQRDNLKDPKKNPKHTANVKSESVQSALDSLNTYYTKNEKLHGSIVQKEDAALDFVKKKIEREHGKGAYVSKDNPRKPQSAAEKAKVAAHKAKLAKQDHRDPTEKASDGRYSDRYSNRGSD
tara:strand:+ start:522 stop:2456 length:1935 start_codon:yes stop_codon:yes gene_type:complete